jgi:hypothetical protein
MIDCCATCYDVRSCTCRLFSRQTSTLLVNVEDVFLVCVRRERERYHRAPVSLGLPSAGGVTDYGGRGAVSDGTMRAASRYFARLISLRAVARRFAEGSSVLLPDLCSRGVRAEPELERWCRGLLAWRTVGLL